MFSNFILEAVQLLGNSLTRLGLLRLFGHSPSGAPSGDTFPSGPCRPLLVSVEFSAAARGCPTWLLQGVAVLSWTSAHPSRWLSPWPRGVPWVHVLLGIQLDAPPASCRTLCGFLLPRPLSCELERLWSPETLVSLCTIRGSARLLLGSWAPLAALWLTQGDKLGNRRAGFLRLLPTPSV